MVKEAAEKALKSIQQKDEYSIKEVRDTGLASMKEGELYFLDERDGQKYRTVMIGPQEVMAENLAYQPQVGEYWAYNESEGNMKKYGYLYSWDAAKNIAPAGWHLPTKEEWCNLFSDAVSEARSVDSISDIRDFRQSLIECFNPLLGGWRFSNGSFHGLNIGAHFWENVADETKYASTHYFDSENYKWGDSLAGPGVRNYGCSIRLFKSKS